MAALARVPTPQCDVTWRLPRTTFECSRKQMDMAELSQEHVIIMRLGSELAPALQGAKTIFV